MPDKILRYFFLKHKYLIITYNFNQIALCCFVSSSISNGAVYQDFNEKLLVPLKLSDIFFHTLNALSVTTLSLITRQFKCGTARRAHTNWHIFRNARVPHITRTASGRDLCGSLAVYGIYQMVIGLNECHFMFILIPF